MCMRDWIQLSGWFGKSARVALPMTGDAAFCQITLNTCFKNSEIGFVCVRHVYESTQFYGIAELLEILGRWAASEKLYQN